MSPQAEKLRNYEAWEKSFRNFENVVHGTDAPGAMDIDACIERNGRFLVMESKPWMGDLGVKVSYGQHLTLSSMSDLPEFDVYLLGEDKGHYWLATYNRETPKVTRWGALWPKTAFLKLTVRGLQSFISEWWRENA